MYPPAEMPDTLIGAASAPCAASRSAACAQAHAVNANTTVQTMRDPG
jgi:hypothetical protein